VRNVRLDPDQGGAVVKALWRNIGVPKFVLAGIDDDDCAVLRLDRELLVISTDFVNARPIVLEFGLGGYFELGRLLVDASISDLCGSGAEPVAMLTALTLPRSASRKDFAELARGIRDEAIGFGIPVVGGDTKLGSCRALAGIAIGRATSEAELFLKNRAKPNDDLWVSGAIGECNAAVMILRLPRLPARLRERARRAVVAPEIPLSKSRAVAKAKINGGGIDVSDGFGADLARMCKASDVGAEIELHRLPHSELLDAAGRLLGIPWWSFALGAGGDYQFLLSASPRKRGFLSTVGFTRVGRVSNKRTISIRNDDGGFSSMPLHGHNDARDASFADEVRALIASSLQHLGISHAL
jgi:thiamine-monophosphate kinase